MRRFKKLLKFVLLAALIRSVLCVPALALDESEVEAAVAASSKEAVTGNVLIWFLCAVAFLKVSQKIDSFMAALSVNVGRTGSSMLAEALIAARGVTTVAGVAGHTLGRGRSTAATQTSAVRTTHKQAGATAHTAQTAVTTYTSNTVQSRGITHTDSRAQTDRETQQNGVIITGHATRPSGQRPSSY